MNRDQKACQSGKQAEQRALRFLQAYGLKHLGSNYCTAGGEIDLIVQDGNTIVFVEVRSRSNNRYMDTIESISPQKVSKIIHASRQYLHRHGISESALCRFDIVTLTGRSESAKIEWIKDAFEA